MPDRTVDLTTSLTVAECARRFKEGLSGGRSVKDLEYYVPEKSHPDAAGVPQDFQIGVLIPRANAQQIYGPNIRMMVWDRGSHRQVRLWALHSAQGAAYAAGLLKGLEDDLSGLAASGFAPPPTSTDATPNANPPTPTPTATPTASDPERPAGMQLPSDIVDMMERYGSFELDPTDRRFRPGGPNSADGWEATQAPLLNLLNEDASKLVYLLSTQLASVGGLGAFGAERTIQNLCSEEDRTGEAYWRLVRVALDFLRHRLTFDDVSPNDRLKWLRLGGMPVNWSTAPDFDVVGSDPNDAYWRTRSFYPGLIGEALRLMGTMPEPPTTPEAWLSYVCDRIEQGEAPESAAANVPLDVFR